MQSELSTLYLLHDEATLAEALRRQVRSRFRVQQVRGWEEPRDSLRRCSPDAVSVVAPYFETDDGSPSIRLRRLLLEFPSSPVITAFRVTEARLRDMQLLMRWGVAEVLDLSCELTGPALLRRLEAVRGHRMRLVLDRALPRVIPSRARALLADAAEVVAVGGRAPELAARLQTGERTLNRWCNKVDLPEPRRLLAWLRVLLAADMLCEGDRPVAAVARACGYASDSSLRNALRLVANTTPADVKAKGFHAVVAEPFAHELGKLRDRGDARSRARSYLN